MKKLINPLTFKTDFPIICLVSHNNAFISWAIRLRTGGAYNHICWVHKVFIKDSLITPMVASQDLIYREKSLDVYMKKGHKMKFYAIKNITCVQQKLLLARINVKLNKPFWKTRYDFLGIIGQALGLNFINAPWTNFCSESVAEDLSKVKDDIPKQPSPADLNDLFKSRPDDFEYLGHWISD